MRAVINKMAFSGVGLYVDFIFGFFSSTLIARALGPEQYGSYAYLLWLVAVCITLINAGISASIIKFTAEFNAKNNVHELASVDIYLRKIQARKCIVVSILLLLYVYHIYEKSIDISMMLILCLLPIVLYFKVFHMYKVSIMKGFENFKGIAQVSACVAPFGMLLVLLGYIMSLDMKGFVFIYFIITTSYFLTSSYFLRKIYSVSSVSVLDSSLKDRVSGHVKTLGVSSVLGYIIFNQSELFFLKHFSMNEYIAYYSVSYQISTAVMDLIPGVYYAIIFPIISRAVSQGSSVALSQVKSTQLYLFQMSNMVTMPIFFSAPYIIDLLYGNKYQPSSIVLQGLMLIAVFKNLGAAPSSFLMSSDRHKYILYATVAFVFLTLGLDYFLIKNYQLNGAVAAYGLSSLIVVMVYNYLAYRELQGRPDYDRLIKTLFSAILSGLFVMYFAKVFGNIYGAIVGSFFYLISYVFLLVRSGAVERNFVLTIFENFFSRFPKLRVFEKKIYLAFFGKTD